MELSISGHSDGNINPRDTIEGWLTTLLFSGVRHAKLGTVDLGEKRRSLDPG